MFPKTAAVEVDKPPKLSVPVVVIVPPVIGQVVAIEVTVPELDDKQLPLTLKHPPKISNPFEKVEVAVVLVAVK